MAKNKGQASTLSLVDPQLLALCGLADELNLSEATLPQSRDFIREMAGLEQDVPKSVIRTEVEIPLRDGAQTQALLYQNVNRFGKSTTPAMMHIHGGGLVMGRPETNDKRHLALCENLGLTILAPTYRLAPEHPYPVPLNDCLDAWAWLHQHAADYDLDRERFVLSGDSAGGGLAAGVSQYIRDHSGDPISHLMMIYPMLDAETGRDANTMDPVIGEFVWTAEMNQFGWTAYLDGTKPLAPASPAAAPSLKDLPPSWIGVGSLDLFLDEDMRYARRLISDGCAVEFKIYPGAIHGFPLVEDANISQAFLHDYEHYLARAIQGQE